MAAIFTDGILKCIFLNDNVWISIKTSLKFVLSGPINNIPAMVQIMAWRRIGDKPLSEPMMLSLLTHIRVTRPQWDKQLTSMINIYLLDENKLVHWLFSFYLPVALRRSLPCSLPLVSSKNIPCSSDNCSGRAVSSKCHCCQWVWSPHTLEKSHHLHNREGNLLKIDIVMNYLHGEGASVEHWNCD